ncbi:hypothetical protein E8E11_006472 [Didymella keratinophila]|nr:hypothetical protein E8E11_006472 [Didymella keratinophila]
MQGKCGTWLIQLFSLPCLKSLSLGSWGIQPYDDWEASLVWPEPTATSGVSDLNFWDASVPADVIVRITDPWHLDKEYERLRGFATMTALHSLDVPWHVIMGSPAGVKISQDHWEAVGDFQYPDSTPGCAGIEQALCSLLPSPDAPNSVLLKSIEFVYNDAHYYKPLPVNLWHVQSAFRKAGVKFEYKLKLAPSDFWMEDSYGAKCNVNQFAATLAKEGLAGVQIALRTEVLGLPERVMEILGLGKEWLDTDEAKEVLFSEKVNTWSRRGVDC